MHCYVCCWRCFSIIRFRGEASQQASSQAEGPDSRTVLLSQSSALQAGRIVTICLHRKRQRSGFAHHCRNCNKALLWGKIAQMAQARRVTGISI